MKLLLAEDDAVLADAVLRALQALGFAMDHAETGPDALHLLLHFQYDAAILDLGLPGMDGLEVIKALRDGKNRTPVLILTARDTIDDRVKGLNYGADDYLAKPFSLLELEARLRALLRRTYYAQESELNFGAFSFDTVGRRLYYQQQPMNLSSRELDVLEVLLINREKLVSKSKLMESLCGWEEEITLNAVEVYIYRLRKKLEPFGLKFRTLRGLGYLLEIDPEANHA